MEIKIVKDSITRESLKNMAEVLGGDWIKAVVDVKQEIMAVGGELHADEEILLMEKAGSKREHTWGINLYPEKSGEEYIEFNSMVNIKPAFGNRSRGIDSREIKDKIRKIVQKLVLQ